MKTWILRAVTVALLCGTFGVAQARIVHHHHHHHHHHHIHH